VIDFIDVHIVVKGRDHHWPTFNVADIAICVGVGLMAVDMFSSRRERSFALSPPPSGVTAPQSPPDSPPPVDPGPGHRALVPAPLPVSPSTEDKS
jgi:signal peptidase II